MDESNWDNVKYIMEKIKPFIALAILIFIVISTINLIKYNHLQEEVKSSCGYQQNESVYCVCRRGVVSEIYTPNNPYFNKSQNLNFSVNETNN